MSTHPVIHQEPGGRAGSRLAIGSMLIAFGLLAVIARVAGVDLSTAFGDQTWPVFVIVPGLVLFAIAFTRTPPDGVGFAIAGSIVTTVGAILLVQANTDTWASWAYVWALLPGAAGLGMATYGLLTGTNTLVTAGARLAVIAGVLYLVGRWYFETLFTTGEQPMDLRTWWPLVLIGVGALIAARGLVTRRRPSTPTTAQEIDGGTKP